MAALTLSEWAQMSNVPYIPRVAYVMANEANSLFSHIPFDVTMAQHLRDAVFDGSESHSVNWRPINDPATSSTAAFATVDAQIFQTRDVIEIDRRLIMDPNFIGDPVDFQMSAYLRKQSQDVWSKFLNNNPVSGERNCFAGLRYRMTASAYAVPSDVKANAAAIDLRPSALTSANALKFLGQLEQLMMVVNGGGMNFGNLKIFCNDTTILALNQALRILGAGVGLNTTVDAYNRTVLDYRGAKFVDPGWAYPFTSPNRILTNTESADGTATTGGTASSLFVCNFAPNAISAFLNPGLEQAVVYSGFENTAGLSQKITFDMGCGFLHRGRMSTGHMFNFRVA